jgi:transcriptional regulator with XRE-family HTH domain
MPEKLLLTGRLVAAARTLTGVSQSELANAAGIPVPVLVQIEASGAAPLQSEHDAEAVGRALENFGAMFIPEGGGIGAGVRLKFLRQDVKQIGRLENEGGIVADDDVP